MRPGRVTKAELIELLQTKLGFGRKASSVLIDMIFGTMKETLERGEDVKISRFGNFELRDKRSRTGRNPKTGELMEISARRVVTFKASQVLKGAMNAEPND